MAKDLQARLNSIEEAAEKLEETLECRILLLIFHDRAPITRDIVDDVELHLQKERRAYASFYTPRAETSMRRTTSA